MRRSDLLLVGAVGAGLVAAVLAVAAGDGGAARAPAPPRLVGGVYYVDRGSAGGRCDDHRPAVRVSRRRPWCSLARAVAAAPPRAVVVVRSGGYGPLRVSDRTARPLTVRAARGARPELHGVTVADSRGVRVEGFRISDIVQVLDSRDVTVSRNELTPHGIVVSGGSRLTFRRNRIHDLTIDIPAPGTPGARCNRQSDHAGLAPRCGYAFRISAASDVLVRGNRVVHVPADGIQLAGTTRVRIERNRFARISPFVDPAEHSDAIQMVGANAGTRIVANRFASTRGIIAHPMAGQDPQWPGAASRMVVARNVFAGVPQWAALLYDVAGVRFARNTAWDAGTLGVAFREDGAHPQHMSGVRFVRNIVARLEADPPMFAREDRNLVADGPRLQRSDVAGTPRFRDRAAGDYRLVPESPYRGLGAPAALARR